MKWVCFGDKSLSRTARVVHGRHWFSRYKFAFEMGLFGVLSLFSDMTLTGTVQDR